MDFFVYFCSMKTAFFTGRMKMADIIAANYSLILVMPRLGIPLGFGEKSLFEVCRQHGLPADFVLLICNVHTFDGFEVDDAMLQSTDLTLLVPYLQTSHRYYLNERLPHIGRHLSRVADGAGERYSTLLNTFFSDYRNEVCDHFLSEEQEIFPYLQQLQQGNTVVRPVARHFVDNHSDIVDKLADLTQIVYKYIPGDRMTEELNELVFGILQLSADLEKHALIEEKILLPYVAQLERRLQR